MDNKDLPIVKGIYAKQMLEVLKSKENHPSYESSVTIEKESTYCAEWV